MLYESTVMDQPVTCIRPAAHPFTERLTTIPQPPRQICYLGHLPTAKSPANPVVAIVGSRKPSPYGIEVTKQFAQELAQAGCIVISGLALGVDCIAQDAALQAGGTVLGVVADALPAISPRANQPLARRIIQQGGAILSEWQSGDGKIVSRWSFLQRNRLVSGLADAVVITEAAERSGTLNTAAHALDQGRDVFVVPGNITSRLSAGCNALLTQGALPATQASDIITVIAPQRSAPQSPQQVLPLASTPAEQTIIQLLAEGWRDGDQLQQRSHLSAADFSTALTMLEVNGSIKPLGANHWALTHRSQTDH